MNKSAKPSHLSPVAKQCVTIYHTQKTFGMECSECSLMTSHKLRHETSLYLMTSLVDFVIRMVGIQLAVRRYIMMNHVTKTTSCDVS